MSFVSPREAAAADAARLQSKYSAQLADLSLPELQKAIQSWQGDLTATGIAPSVQAAFAPAQAGIEKDYASAQRSQQFGIEQRFKQSGLPYSQNQLADAERQAATALDAQRFQANKNLQFAEAQAGMQQYNNLLNLLGAGSGAALNLGKGFSSVQQAAIGGLSNTSPGQGALGGAASGAAIGSEINAPWGTIIGGVLGGAAGYFGAGG